MKTKKILVLSVMLTALNLVASDISNIEAKLTKYEKNIEKLQENIVDNNDILTGLKIISGKAEAGKNISTKFDYYKTSVYEIFAKPNHTTVLKLSNDEEVIYVGGGDKENWEVEETRGGADNSTYLILKPLFENIQTNFNIITDKRTYFISLFSTENNYNPFVEWNYPYNTNGMQFKNITGTTSRVNKDINLEGNFDNLIFGYKYNTKKSFSPLQVFNDGTKTILVMKDNLMEAPVIYGYGEDNKLSLVNFRYQGNKIIIDKVLDKLELKLGKETLLIRRK